MYYFPSVRVLTFSAFQSAQRTTYLMLCLELSLFADMMMVAMAGGGYVDGDA